MIDDLYYYIYTVLEYEKLKAEKLKKSMSCYSISTPVNINDRNKIP